MTLVLLLAGCWGFWIGFLVVGVWSRWERRGKLNRKRLARLVHRARRGHVRWVRLPLVILKPMDDAPSHIVSLS